MKKDVTRLKMSQSGVEQPIRMGSIVKKYLVNLKAVDSIALFRVEHCQGQFFSKLTSLKQRDTCPIVPQLP